VNLETLQFIALVLEIFGFSLAVIDTFNRSLSRRVDSIIRVLNTRMGTFDIYFTTAGVDYEGDISSEEADNVEFRRFFFFLTCFISFWILILVFPTGNSNIANIFYAAFQAVVIYFIIRFLIILVLINLMMKAIDFFGRKNFIAGVGFIIAMIGIMINSFQVFVSNYVWEGITLWSMIFILVYIYWKESN
jgi:hypothetical protein